MRRNQISFLAVALLLFFTLPAVAQEKPNILVIWGDDVGWFNISSYNMGMMGYETPNIDRIAKGGVLFTDFYGQQSCTAGRSAFITGQSPIRTGLTKVGMPGSTLGHQPEDVSMAELLKNHGYRTGQFGKNHLGDLDKFLPSAHGFDEFYGNLYHLNAEEEPEDPDYPHHLPKFKEMFGPRGVIHSYADGRIEDTGPLTKKRMETVDEEFLQAALGFIDTANAAGEPFFVWFNATRMHIWTHLKKESEGVTGQGIYADGMVEHDGHVGQLLDKLEQLGITENTIVMYSTDNGAETFSWPDGGTVPFRGEKNTNWEGGYRVPCVLQWPGKIPAGKISNEIMSHEDWVPTLLAAAGEPDVKEKLLKGHTANGKSFQNHLDGYNFLPYLTGKDEKGPRREFYYWTDDGAMAGVRYNDWKMVFMEQREHGFNVWQEPLTPLRVPKLFNLRRDPFERADHEAIGYERWRIEKLYMLYGGSALVQMFVKSFEKFPPRQRPASFSVDQIMEQFTRAQSN
jgi:arylsulfatase